MKIGKAGNRILTGLCVGAAVLTSSIIRNSHRNTTDQATQIYKEEPAVKILNSKIDSMVKVKTDSIINSSVSKAVSSAVRDTVPGKVYYDATQLLGDSIKTVMKSVK